MERRRGVIVFALLSIAVILMTSPGCRLNKPDPGGDTSDTVDPEDSGNPPDTGTDTTPTDEDTGSPSPDTGNDTDRDTGPTGGDDADGGSMTEGIPDQITTAGGASFTGEIGAGERRDLDLVAQKGDVIVMHLRRAEGTDWQPGLYLFQPGDSTNKDNRIAWHEPQDDGPAHIPYEDSKLSEGWEFYESGTYQLQLRNMADSSGKLSFELECLGGPCTSSDSNDGNGSDGDGVSATRDNCPSADNAGQQNGDHDIWGDACDSKPNTLTCPNKLSDGDLEQRLRAAYKYYQAMDYDQAREEMFSRIDNDGGTVEAVYTGEMIQTTGIPNPEEYNTEHTWPRSKMKNTDKPSLSDLNHLFPTDATANKKRSNLPFDEVTGTPEWSAGGSKRGPNDRGWKVFEPRDAHKGNAARALFYYAVVYNRDIDIDAERDGWGLGTGEEQTLRNWHKSVDPVNQVDRDRNKAIQNVQGNRNPFVDCPGLVGQISDF
ncbi:MAG: endonuclease I family protein [Bradymonadaceae bacterium]